MNGGLVGKLRLYTRVLLGVFDIQLAIIFLLLLCAGLITLSSAGSNLPDREIDQVRNVILAFAVMYVAASISPYTLMRFAVPAYTVGIVLLIAVAFFGIIKNGSRRWINLGLVVQPSEILKIAMPMMLAWYFQKREGFVRWYDFFMAAFVLMVPVTLIARQPDLGTALLVLAAGFYVIFFAGLPWKMLVGFFVLSCACLPVMWFMLHDYQRDRILVLLDASKDPLGRGFHIIQSTIAIGSGGVLGRGWMQGTQTHLEFVPERTTDFIFAVFGEEFGLLGNVVLLSLYMLLIVRGMAISSNAPSLFARLLAGAITMIFFTYAFVNMGMVSGILPVVGVPLPLMSYGGTALVTLSFGVGILMSIQRYRKLIPT